MPGVYYISDVKGIYNYFNAVLDKDDLIFSVYNLKEEEINSVNFYVGAHRTECKKVRLDLETRIKIIHDSPNEYEVLGKFSFSRMCNILKAPDGIWIAYSVGKDGSIYGYFVRRTGAPTVYSYDPKDNFFTVYHIKKPDDLVVDAPGLGFNIGRYREQFTYRVHFHFHTDDKQIVKLFNCGVEVAKFAVSKPVFEYPNALDPTYVLDGDWKNLVGLTDTTTEHVVMRIIGGIVRGFSELIFKARDDKGLCKCTIKDVLIHCHWTDDNNVHLVKFVNNLNKLMESWKKPDDKWGLAFFQYTEEGRNKKAYPPNAILFDADEELSNALAVPSMQIPIIRGKRKISIMDVFIEVAQMKRIRINRNTFRTEVTKNYEEFCSHEYVGKRSIGQCDCEDPVICKLINHLFVGGVLYD
eukprot:907597_1